MDRPRLFARAGRVVGIPIKKEACSETGKLQNEPIGAMQMGVWSCATSLEL
jgi:hypothetical protein